MQRSIEHYFEIVHQVVKVVPERISSPAAFKFQTVTVSEMLNDTRQLLNCLTHPTPINPGP